ncbi:SDR family NAD(P)-dependent oxidoreductase [Paenibacillus sp. sgz500958]|uniref:SDR family NAD(P)-dependent oxidoreductase n=1 Tax=Paenibacillus sp. sgz500958 TaxID=3242475 RepID=UPI0036D2A90A
MNIDFSGKVVIITGGSRGIGRGLVHNFARANAIVYFTYLSNEDKAATVIEECKKQYGADVVGLKVDGTSKEDVDNFVKMVWNTHKRMDVVVNNAAWIPRGLFLQMSEGNWIDGINANLNSVIYFCSSAIKFMILKKSGSIINISSRSALQPGRGQAVYSATKGAVESLTKVLALEYGPYNIRVNTLAPGLVETDVVDTMQSELKQKILDRTPLGRFGTADDISNAALFLASDYASYITGTQLLVTGGRHLD